MLTTRHNPPVPVRFPGLLGGDSITDAITNAAAGAIQKALAESWPDIQAKMEASANKFWAKAEASLEERGYQVQRKVQPWAVALLGLSIVSVILTGVVIARQR